MSIIRRRGYARTIFIPGINQDVAPRGFYRQGHYASIVMYACKKATVGNRDPGNTCPTFPLLFSPPPPIQQSGSSLRRSLPKERDSSSSVIAPTPFPSLYERRPRWHGTRIRRGCILTPSSSFRAPASAFSFPRASSFHAQPGHTLDISHRGNMRYDITADIHATDDTRVDVCLRFCPSRRHDCEVFVGTRVTSRGSTWKIRNYGFPPRSSFSL